MPGSAAELNDQQIAAVINCVMTAFGGSAARIGMVAGVLAAIALAAWWLRRRQRARNPGAQAA